MPIVLFLMAFWHGSFPYLGPVTTLHYAAGDSTGALGFNLADVSSKAALDAIPSADLGLVFIGTCNGADTTFQNFVNPFNGDAKLWGFYIMDEPLASNCTLANLKAEVDYIHANITGAKTFVVMENLGTQASPSFAGYLTPSSTDLDYVGLDPYPARSDLAGNFDASVINRYVTAAAATGFTTSQLIPVYQAFGQYNNAPPWILPTLAQTEAILNTWGPLLPTPAFDYAYAYGQQLNDYAIVNTPYLSVYYAARNSSGGTPTCSNSLNFSQSCNSVLLEAVIER